MAGVLERIIGPQRRLVSRSERVRGINPRVLELQTAMEILAEVFGINASEVEEMLLQRCEVDVQSYKGEGASWPESFSIE